MKNVDGILQEIELSSELRASRSNLEFDSNLGFLTADIPFVEREVGQKTLLGFGISGWQKGTDEIEDNFEGITDISDLDESVLTIDRQGKGVGARMYNTRQALGATAELPSQVGMYAFNIDPDEILDKRSPADGTVLGKAHRIVEHGRLKLVAALSGVEKAIDIVHSNQGDAEAVLYNQTPHGEWQKQKRHEPVSPVPEELMVVRKPHTMFFKVGECRS